MADLANGFVHLRVRSAYSLLEGAIKADKTPKLAAAEGMPAIGIADRANLFGALEFSVAAKESGVQPLVACALPVTGIGEGPPERWARTPTLTLPASRDRRYHLSREKVLPIPIFCSHCNPSPPVPFLSNA